MKNIRKILLASFLVFFAIVTATKTFADTPPPPPPPEGGHGQGGSQVPGGGAPVGSGITILLALGAGYGGKKVYNTRKRNPAE